MLADDLIGLNECELMIDWCADVIDSKRQWRETRA